MIYSLKHNAESNLILNRTKRIGWGSVTVRQGDIKVLITKVFKRRHNFSGNLQSFMVQVLVGHNIPAANLKS
jgi:hypothetical protein